MTKTPDVIISSSCGYSDVLFENWQKEPLINGIRGFSPPLSLGTSLSTPGTINLPVSPAQRVSVPLPPVVSGCRVPFVQPETASRLIKTNCDDDVKSYNFAIYRFKEYIRKREDWYIQIHGKVKLTETGFTYNKTDVHRWKDGYLKKRLARFYKLRDWFEVQPSQDVTMVTLTVPHNVNRWGKTVNTGNNIYQAWKNLKQGWNRLRQCKALRGREFVIIYEPHKSGYPHAHLMVFGTPFTEEEMNHLKELWSEMTGAALVGWEQCKKRPGEKIWELVDVGVVIRPGIGVKHLVAYLMKYISKTLYHTMSEWTPGEWLFNAIAHEGRYRLFGSSNVLAEVMRLNTESDDSIETLDVSLHGLNPRDKDDSVCSSRLWTNPNRKTKNISLVNSLPSISTSEMVERWKKKNNIVESGSEIKFKIKREKARLWAIRKQADHDRKYGAVSHRECEKARLERLAMGLT